MDTDDRFINIQPTTGQSLFTSDFDLTYSSNLPTCAPSGAGRASGRRIVLTGCFSGACVTPDQALSDDGAIRMFFNFRPDLTAGVWVEIQRGQRRFGFTSNAKGCELTSPTTTPVTVAISDSDVRNEAGPFETTIASFTIQGGGAVWQGHFVGVSGLRLTRGSEVLELERRQGTHTCPP